MATDAPLVRRLLAAQFPDWADLPRASAALSNYPLALASALRKMDAYGKKIPLPVNPAVAPLFIVQPLLPGGLGGLFATHPPITERVARLERMAGAELPARF